MNEFRSVTFLDIEKHIHSARLARSAALGEMIGNTLADAWHSTQRMGTALAKNYEALKSRTAANPYPTGRRRVATPH